MMTVTSPNAAVAVSFSVYALLTLLVGVAARHQSRTAGDFLNATRALPLPLVVVAYLASNCGALEIVGLSAMAAQYGVQALHFYWIGAIPAMVFLALVLMPVYRRSGVRSVPEYLLFRFGPRARLLNASTTAGMLLLLSGISLYAMAEVLEVVLNFTFPVSVGLSAAVVLAYVLVGGIRATMYNEVLQLAVMVAGLLPLALRCVRFTTHAQLAGVGSRAHLWLHLPWVEPRAHMDRFGIIVGLGFVLSFGYWCTDFVLMQRAFAARSELAARQVPLWAGFGKMAFSLLVVVPGLTTFSVLPGLGHTYRFDQALPALMKHLYSPVMLGIGLTALAASLMSGLAANVSAFASIWTEDIYRTSIRRERNEAHYLSMGRIAIVFAILVSMAASYLNFFFTDLMEHVQLIFSVLGAPFWAIFLLGMLTRRASERGAIIGFLCGAATSFAHSIAVHRGLLTYGSTMISNFYAAVYAFAMALALGWVTSRGDPRPEKLKVILQWKQGAGHFAQEWLLWCLAFLLLASCAYLNFLWR